VERVRSAEGIVGVVLQTTAGHHFADERMTALDQQRAPFRRNARYRSARPAGSGLRP